MTAPRLYYMPRTRSSRVLWLLEEIGAPYDLTEIRGAERRSEEHLLRHPLGRVPALELGDGATMFESAFAERMIAALVGPSDETVERDRHVAGGVRHRRPPKTVAMCTWRKPKRGPEKRKLRRSAAPSGKSSSAGAGFEPATFGL